MVLSLCSPLGAPLAALGTVFCAGGAVEVGGVAEGAECGCGLEGGMRLGHAGEEGGGWGAMMEEESGEMWRSGAWVGG